MKRFIAALVACTVLSGAAYAGTPTLDGIFDGTGVWGTPKATNATPGWAGVTATNLYVTDDATYVYVGAELTGMASWMSYGFAIHCSAGGGNTLEPWLRQITFNFTNAPDFVLRGNCNDGWRELRTWNGSNWGTGAGVDYGSANARVGASFIEGRILKSTLGNPPTPPGGDIQFYITGNQNAHGTFSSIPTDDIATSWNQSPPNVLDNPALSVPLPVTVSGFAID